MINSYLLSQISSPKLTYLIIKNRFEVNFHSQNLHNNKKEYIMIRKLYVIYLYAPIMDRIFI